MVDYFLLTITNMYSSRNILVVECYLNGFYNLTTICVVKRQLSKFRHSCLYFQWTSGKLKSIIIKNKISITSSSHTHLSYSSAHPTALSSPPILYPPFTLPAAPPHLLHPSLHTFYTPRPDHWHTSAGKLLFKLGHRMWIKL